MAVARQPSGGEGRPMRAAGPMRVLLTPWPLVFLGLIGLALGAAFAPLWVSAIVVVLAALAGLVRAFGARQGIWYLALALIPMRQVLSVDVYGSASFFFSDLLILALFAEAASRNGFRDLWSRSPTFRMGLVILVLSVLGLYRAFRPFWGFVSVYVIFVQLALFYVARFMIRSGRDARRALLAVLTGLVPAIIYGLYQASLPYGAELPAWGAFMTAYGPSHEPYLRVFSTFPHPLRFSHYLSIGVGIATGLVISQIGKLRRMGVLAVGAAAAVANAFTYSIGGMLAMIAGVAAALSLTVRRSILILVLVLIVPVVLIFPGVMRTRMDTLVTGQSSSLAARVITYQQALDVLIDHPVRGVGWGAIRSSLEGKYRISRAEIVAFVAENYFLHRAMALGVPGLFLYLAICALFFRNAIRSRDGPAGARWPRPAILAGGAAFYVQAQVMPSTDASVNYAGWLLLAAAEAMYEATRGAGGGRGGSVAGTRRGGSDVEGSGGTHGAAQEHTRGGA
jgi:O-antigen ligase